MAKKILKCAFPHCSHESRELLREEATRVGTRYMHPDCARTSKYITMTKELYYEEISNTVVMKNLGAVINNIVFKKGVDAGYLYFALEHTISAKIPLKSPYGLHYIIDNSRIRGLWEKKRAEDIKAQMIKESSVEKVAIALTSFKYVQEKERGGFGSILKRGVD